MRRNLIPLAALLLCLLLSGCGATRASAAEQWNLTRDPLTAMQAAALERQAIEMAEGYRELLPEPGATANYGLTQSQTLRIVESLARQGLTVIDADGSCDLQNPQPAIDFGRAVGEEKDAAVSVWIVHRDGGVSGITFSLQNDIQTVTEVRVVWDGQLQPQVSSISRRDILSLRCTEKGYLIWQARDLDSVVNGPDYVPWRMLRIAPLDETCRQLCQTYIRPVGYANSNLFLTDWTVKDPGELVWNDVFPACYFLQTGTLLTSHACGGYSFDAQVGLLVPEADYVRYISTYFPVDAQALTAASERDETSGCYPVRLFTSGDMASRLPTPEVVDWQENSDGSLTMTVEALDFETGSDCAFRHRVTVQPKGDGTWYFLQNQVILDPETPKNGDATAG